MTASGDRAGRQDNAVVADLVCCPNCWKWAPLGQRATCKKCGTLLVHADGRGVAQPVPQEVVATPPPPLPSVAPIALAQVPPLAPLAPPAPPATAVNAPAPPAMPPNPPAPPQFAELMPPPLAEVETPRGRSRVFRALAATVVAAAVAGAITTGILAFRFVHGSADSLVRMAPDDTIAYVNVNLDPSAGQKLAIASLLSKFPGLSDSARDSTINAWLDTALGPDGLSHDDVRPWLGPEMSVVALPAHAGVADQSPQVVVLLASADDSRAQAMFDKFRGGPIGSSLHWTSTTYDGSTINSGSGAEPGAYAIADGAVIISSDPSGVETVLDTANGKHADVASTSDYTTVQAQLPSDRVASLFVDMPAITKAISSSSIANGPGMTQTLTGLEAYRGIGAAMVVSSTGVTVNAVQDYDPAKLTSAQRASLAVAPHVNGALSFVPANAYGFVAVGGLGGELRSLIDSFSAVSTIQPVLDQLGITGSAGIIDHLRGDAAIEVDSTPGNGAPAGAVVFEVDSASAAKTFLGSLASKVCALTTACTPGQQTTQVYKGVDITTVGPAGAANGLSPSFAVRGDWAIIASSTAEVKSVLDAAGGSGVTTSSRFAAVASETGTNNTTTFYLDIHRIVGALRGKLSPADAATFDQKVAPYVSHLQALGMSSQNASDHTSSAFFLLIN